MGDSAPPAMKFWGMMGEFLPSEHMYVCTRWYYYPLLAIE